MEYVAFDLEWNRPESAKEFIKEPISFPGEIIQIGAVKLDENLGITDTFNVFIKPVYYTKLHTFVSELTHITDETLENGSPFLDAINKFREWCPEDCILLTWSNNDKKILKQNIRMHGEKYNWLPHAIDIQPLFSYYVVKEARQYSLNDANNYIGEPDFVPHNALNDAFATAKIGHYLIKNNIEIKDPYKIPKRKTVHISEPDEIRYPSNASARNARENREFFCTECQGWLRCNWIIRHGGKSYSLVKCRCDKEYFVRLICRANGDGTKRANLTIAEATDEHRAFYKNLIEEERIKAQNKLNHWIYNLNRKNRKKYR